MFCCVVQSNKNGYNEAYSIVIGCEDRLRNDLDCVGWGVKLYSNQTIVPIGTQ